MLSLDNVEDVKQLYNKLQDRFEQFKVTHMQCLEVIPQTDVIKNLEKSYESHRENFIEFQEHYSQWIAKEENMNTETNPVIIAKGAFDRQLSDIIVVSFKTGQC